MLQAAAKASRRQRRRSPAPCVLGRHGARRGLHYTPFERGARHLQPVATKPWAPAASIRLFSADGAKDGAKDRIYTVTTLYTERGVNFAPPFALAVGVSLRA